MGDQPAQLGVGLMDVAQVACAVQGVQARHGKARRVSDVVQPPGRLQEIGVRAQNRCQAACPGGDALDMRPAAGEGHLQECLGEIFGPRASGFMRPRLDNRLGTFTDLACRRHLGSASGPVIRRCMPGFNGRAWPHQE